MSIFYNKGKKPTCKKDCPPKVFDCPYDGFGCDVCKRNPRFKKGDTMYGCRNCNWDCCKACWDV